MTAPLACLLLIALSTARTIGTNCDQTDLDKHSTAAGIFPTASRPGGARSGLGPAKGRLLVASRNLLDPNFAETVVLLLAHEAGGTMGVVINRPTDVRLASALPKIDELRGRTDRVYLGGPVSGTMLLILVRAARRPRSSELIFGDVYASGRLSALREALGKPGSTNRLRAYAGHAGWGAGQLKREIARGDWYVATADAQMVFESKPSEIWPTLIERSSGQWTRRADRKSRKVDSRTSNGGGTCTNAGESVHLVGLDVKQQLLSPGGN